jgi:integrase
MASIRKITYTTPGGKRRIKFAYSIQVARDKQERRFFDDEQTAINELAKRQRELQEGRSDRIVPVTLQEAVDKFGPYVTAKGLRTSKELADRLRKQVIPYFGANTKVSQITAESIRRWEQHLTSEKVARIDGTRSAATVNRLFALLRRLLRLCKKWGHLRDVPHFEMAKEPPGRIRFLTREEAQRLLDACRGKERRKHNPHLASIVVLALHSGMRRGEILALTWERVDFSRGVLVLDQTKNGRRREVPMSETVYGVLSEIRKAQAVDDVLPTHGPVFRHRRTGARMHEINNGFAVVAREAKLADFRFHDLRHTCASWLVQDGASLQEVKEILGHRDLTMTLRYAHLAPGHLRSAVARLDNVFRVESVPAASRDSAELPSQRAVAVRK